MARLTAQKALHNVIHESGWQSDALARDTAIQALVDDGYDLQAAERAVDKAMAEIKPMGAN